MSQVIEHPKQAFILKGSIFTLTVLQLVDATLDKIKVQLDELMLQAPKFFQNAPVVIDLQQLLHASDALNLSILEKELRQRGLIPVGIRGGTPAQHLAAKEVGLAVLSVAKHESQELTTGRPKAEKEKKTKDKKDKVEVASPSGSKLITKPVRSGQQVYAKDGDLIVLSSVSPGAELLADGNIHVYGTLHGRALAGITGNVEARIFCHGLDAELISIAGRYIVNEALISKANEEPTQIYLGEGGLRIEPLY